MVTRSRDVLRTNKIKNARRSSWRNYGRKRNDLDNILYYAGNNTSAYGFWYWCCLCLYRLSLWRWRRHDHGTLTHIFVTLTSTSCCYDDGLCYWRFTMSNL